MLSSRRDCHWLNISVESSPWEKEQGAVHGTRSYLNMCMNSHARARTYTRSIWLEKVHPRITLKSNAFLYGPEEVCCQIKLCLDCVRKIKQNHLFFSLHLTSTLEKLIVSFTPSLDSFPPPTCPIKIPQYD